VASLFIYAILAVTPAHESFFTFMKTHDKTYKSDVEFTHRFNVFKENLNVIDQLNALDNTTGAASFGINKFADLSTQEFKTLYLMSQPPTYNAVPAPHRMGLPRAPEKFDWRETGFITRIKNQGQCGSCWAFSATENIESVYSKFNNINPPIVLGPQQMVDCDSNCYGCGGGWPYYAFQYITSAGGQDTETTYPYSARDGTCRFDPHGVGAKISGYKSIPKDEAQIQALVADTEKGAPFSICVDASSWQFYKGGVMTATQCGRSVDHCTQLIGYDASKSAEKLPFWIVRNSWGTDWGVQGIILLEMFKDTCIMADYVTTAIPVKA